MRNRLLFLAAILFMVLPTYAQNGTAHGVQVSANPSTSTVIGYNVYRCPGTCTLTSTWTRIATLLPTPSYLDPPTLAPGTYSYVMTAQDASSNESQFSNISTTTITSFPINPVAPTGCNAKPI